MNKNFIPDIELMASLSMDRQGQRRTLAAKSHVLLLGPYAGDRSYSLANYFNFYRRALPNLHSSLSVTAACPGGVQHFDNSTLQSASRPEAWQATYLRWPFELRKVQADLFHIVDQGLAWYARFLPGGLLVTTVHDLIAHMICEGKLPFPTPPRKRRFLIRECVRQLKRMHHLIAVSEFTAATMMRELEIPASRITVIPNHVDDSFSPLSHAERTAARARWFGSTPFAVVHVGMASVYKNRIGALKAFALLHKRIPEARMFLVHGQPEKEESEFLKGSPCAEAIQFLPAMSRRDLREFYGAADVLIFPSLYEGFGWPPLEAMACECPVVSSSAASLKEVVGDAGLVINDPHDHAALAEALHTVLMDSATASALREKGLARVRLFRPAMCLERVGQVYERLLAG